MNETQFRKYLKNVIKYEKRAKSKRNTTKKKYGVDMDGLAGRLKGKPYQVFLNSKYWHLVRRKVMKRDGFKCRICQSTDNLIVHHVTYKHHFKEHKHLNELMTMCTSCHTEYHETVFDFSKDGMN